MTYQDPNFTIVTSGGCNSFCNFCTDPFKRKASTDYLKNLEEVLFNRLPKHFTQVSISGGEPTLSPDLGRILGLIKLSNRFEKVVLTTNGSKLKEKLNVIIQGVNHVNVSRHAIGYEANTQIFGTLEIINDQDLAEVSAELNEHGIDVNLNHVYSDKDKLDKDYVLRFVAYAKSVGATSVSFRYDQNENNMKETYLEKIFANYKVLSKGACAVCRNHTVLVAGLPVVFKASYAEPSVAISDVYELIYHITGKLTTDWEGNFEFGDSTKRMYLKQYEQDPTKQHVAAEMPRTIPKIVPRSSPLPKTVVNPLPGINEVDASVNHNLPEPARHNAVPRPAKTKSLESYGGGCGGSRFGGGCA
jgi:organic radical activating enzyme